MRRIRVTLPDGSEQTIVVEEILFINTCPHCDQEFCSPDHRKVYPDESHKRIEKRNRSWIGQ